MVDKSPLSVRSKLTSYTISTALDQPVLTPISDRLTNRTIAIKWDAIVAAKHYEIRFENKIQTAEVNQFEAENLTPGTNYDIEVRAVSAGSKPSSEWAPMTVYTRVDSPLIEVEKIEPNRVHVKVSRMRQYDQLTYEVVNYMDRTQAEL